MTQILVIVLLSLLVASAHAGPFETCILENMKGVQAQAAAQAIYRACKEKTTPKKCRDGELSKPRLVEFVDNAGNKSTTLASLAGESLREAREQCLAACVTSSYWSRTFGECSTD